MKAKNWLDNFHLPLQILSYPPSPFGCVPKDADIWGCVNWAPLPYGFWLGQGEEVAGVSRLEREIKVVHPSLLSICLSLRPLISSGHVPLSVLTTLLCSASITAMAPSPTWSPYSLLVSFGLEVIAAHSC